MLLRISLKVRLFWYAVEMAMVSLVRAPLVSEIWTRIIKEVTLFAAEGRYALKVLDVV
jgi:hypothetical protein